MTNCSPFWLLARGRSHRFEQGIIAVLGSMRLIATLIDLYSVVVLAAVIMSWVHADRRHPLVQWVFNATEPALAPIRRIMPSSAGLDFSPMILLVLLRILRSLW